MAPLLAQRPRVDRSFERLYQRHVSDVYHYALAVLRNPSDAEDVTQTAFLNAYNAYRRGERPNAPRNWLIAIAHNVCRQRFRQTARRPHEVVLEDDVADSLVQDDAPSAHDIRTALGHLAFNQRAALVMRELEGRTYAEIGEILGLTVSAVETLIFRARRALREQLEGSLTCQQAELALSRQLDGRLPRSERGGLRAHLRACPDCASFARSQRAQRAAVRSIAAVPLPGSLASFFGGGAAMGGGLAVKAAVLVAAGAVVTGVGYEGITRLPARAERAAAVEATADASGAARPTSANRVESSSAGVSRPERATVLAVPAANGGAKAKAGGRGHAEKASTSGADRPRGRPATPPGQTKARTTAVRGHGKAKPQRTHVAPGRTKVKTARAKPRPSTAPDRGRPEQPGKSEPKDKKGSGLPLPDTPVSVPAIPTPPAPPAPLLEPGKK